MIYLASDHRGFLRKEEVKKWLFLENAKYEDVGNTTYNKDDDEVDFVKRGCQRMEADIAEGKGTRGIFFCGSGVMVDVAANRFSQIRSCVAINTDQVRMARNDDDVNVLCIAADFFGEQETLEMVQTFLGTTFSGEERYKRRLEKLKNLVS